jgi:hypothetical protein
MVFAVAAAPGYFVAAVTMDRLGRKTIQAIGFGVMESALQASLWFLKLTKPLCSFSSCSDWVISSRNLVLMGPHLYISSLPETKGKSLEQITGETGHDSETSAGQSATRRRETVTWTNETP